ncbi:fumarylacetoacetate hydrolase family protein [Variovorax sp. J22P168]|uniref:fumarylacetoacetate hydrolase family protein n=1 Tax=Variovorax jilinensis TaxID=3053513 RepID=UPI002577D9AA|nr:fumarylacetoacetate hydrolase family protein [Variovorax sp. J22P168]MDM0014949.1 fumarylacetoacetate hydrolase family protein [Variovorax sp. J22P168]
MTPIDRATHALLKARETRRPVPAPDLADAADAYAVQESVARALHWFDDNERTGSAAGHWKSGGPSREAQAAHAPLPPTGVWASPADARGWHFHLRGIEAEIALRMGSDIDAARAAALDPRSASRLVDAMCVSIELVDSRWSEALAAPDLAKMADLLSHGALVLGAWQAFSPPDWSTQTCRLTIGSGPALTFQGTHSMGDPAWLLPAWLRHATRDGRTVRAGTVLTTGTWCGLAMAAAGDRVRAEFPGIGSAEVQL